jgi:hypothetical protein
MGQISLPSEQEIRLQGLLAQHCTGVEAVRNRYGILDSRRYCAEPAHTIQVDPRNRQLIKPDMRSSFNPEEATLCTN